MEIKTTIDLKIVFIVEDDITSYYYSKALEKKLKKVFEEHFNQKFKLKSESRSI